MVRVGGIVEIFLTDLIERLGTVGVRMPWAAFRIAPLQQIDHQAVAQTPAGDENVIQADLRHDLVEDESAGDDDIRSFGVAADHGGALGRGLVQQQFQQGFKPLAPQHDQRSGAIRITGNTGVGFRQRGDGAAAAEGHGEFFLMDAPHRRFELRLNIGANFLDLSVAGRVVGDHLFGQANRAEGQAEQAIGVGGVGDREFDAAAADVEEQTEREMEAQAAHDAEADEPRFVFLG